MARIFLDVGAHDGETVAVAAEARFGFDRIFAFEPASVSLANLRVIADGESRLTVLDYGLWDRDGTVPLFSPGTVGASIFSDKVDLLARDSETISLRRASDWFSEHLDPTDRVWCKLNCEGAESAILDDLVATGQIDRLWALRVHVDAAKVPSLGESQAAKTRATVRAFDNPRYFLAEDTPAKTYPGSMAAWLCASGADADREPTSRSMAWRRLRYSAAPRGYMPMVRAGSRLKRRVVPYR